MYCHGKPMNQSLKYFRSTMLALYQNSSPCIFYGEVLHSKSTIHRVFSLKCVLMTFLLVIETYTGTQILYSTLK